MQATAPTGAMTRRDATTTMTTTKDATTQQTTAVTKAPTIM